MTADKELIEAYELICNWLVNNSCLSPEEHENAKDSAERIAKGFRQMILTREELIGELKKQFSTRFPSSSSGQLVMQSGIQATSLCPHHLLPIKSVIHYGYVTEVGKEVIGLSKFVRIAQLLASRAVIQEQLTKDLIQVMTEGTVGIDGIHKPRNEWTPHKLGSPVSKSVGVIVNAEHGCMSCRGVNSPSRTNTSLFTGLLNDRIHDYREDFYKGIEEYHRLSR